MADPRFYDNRGPFPLGHLAQVLGAGLATGADPALPVSDVCDITALAAGELCYALGPQHAARLAECPAAICIVSNALAGATPQGMALLLSDQPQAAFARATALFYPDAATAMWPVSETRIDPTARLDDGVRVSVGAVIGPGTHIGAGTVISANAVIGRGVCIGRNCHIGPGVTIACALIGDRVAIQAGSRIGNDGFGFVPAAAALIKIPQLGRVIIQDDVEIGANCCIDRGALGDTVIGEGAKLDNLVHVAHNCRIGRYAILAGQVGFSGSVTIGDGVIMGGQVGIADHVTIGHGARLAAGSGVTRDLDGGQDYGGAPARPIAVWRREVAAVRRLVKGTKRSHE